MPAILPPRGSRHQQGPFFVHFRINRSYLVLVDLLHLHYFPVPSRQSFLHTLSPVTRIIIENQKLPVIHNPIRIHGMQYIGIHLTIEFQRSRGSVYIRSIPFGDSLEHQPHILRHPRPHVHPPPIDQRTQRFVHIVRAFDLHFKRSISDQTQRIIHVSFS